MHPNCANGGQFRFYPPNTQVDFQFHQQDGHFQPRPQHFLTRDQAMGGSNYYNFQRHQMQNTSPRFQINQHVNNQNYMSRPPYCTSQPPVYRSHFSSNNNHYLSSLPNQNFAPQQGEYGNNSSGNWNTKSLSRKYINHSSCPVNEKGENFHCEPCEREFASEKAFVAHKEQHKQCEEEGCSFTASSKALKLHHVKAHAEGKFRIVLETPEQIAEWREQRKRNWPTPENIARKKKKLKEDKEDGIIVETKEFIYREEGGARGKGSNRKGCDHNNSGRRKENKYNHGNKEDWTMQEENHGNNNQMKTNNVENHSFQKSTSLEIPKIISKAVVSIEAEEERVTKKSRISFIGSCEDDLYNCTSESEGRENENDIDSLLRKTMVGSNNKVDLTSCLKHKNESPFKNENIAHCKQFFEKADDDSSVNKFNEEHSVGSYTCMLKEIYSDANNGSFCDNLDTLRMANKNEIGKVLTCEESAHSGANIMLEKEEEKEFNCEIKRDKAHSEKEEGESDSEEDSDIVHDNSPGELACEKHDGSCAAIILEQKDAGKFNCELMVDKEYSEKEEGEIDLEEDSDKLTCEEHDGSWAAIILEQKKEDKFNCELMVDKVYSEKEEGEIDSEDSSPVPVDCENAAGILSDDIIQNESNNKKIYKQNRYSLHHRKKNKQKGIQERLKAVGQMEPVSRRISLLDMLLANEIRHERNVVLQCIRYIVRENFFDSKGIASQR